MLLSREILEGQSGGRYEIKIASNQQEVESAYRLRYEVFNLELRRGFLFEDGKDYDEFDEQFHHLIIKNKDEGKVVGTYRLQTYEQAVGNKGFYTDKRFHMDQFPEKVLAKGVEVGRACIRDDHRSGRVLFLLWKGLAAYIQHFDKRYLFGSSAISSAESSIALSVRNYLKENDFFHPEYEVDVRKPFRVIGELKKSEEAEIEIPQLFQNYLDVGSRVCGGPALDEKAKSIYFLTLLDIESISDRTRKMFFG